MMHDSAKQEYHDAGSMAFYDYHPHAADLRDDVLRGLRRRPRAIGPKFFYDERGSHLFDAICQTPEYYPTRTETAILQRHRTQIARRLPADCVLLEPGSGNSRKVRILLDAVRPRAYVPMDISRDYLRDAARQVAAEYPWLAVHAVCADYTTPLVLPARIPRTRKVAFFPGSTIGNFEPAQAIAFLRTIARQVDSDGGLLIGVDLKKDPARLHAAYNDAAGITAAFNLNLLTRINRELGGDFDLAGFEHRAYYNGTAGRIEMHLVARTPQRVNIDGEHFDFVAGESIHTENSYKYSIDEFQTLASQAGFTPVDVWTDAARLFSLHYLRVRRTQARALVDGDAHGRG
jgi:dimethylhistidine N-methyltransferase